jgi:hypothetical protein
MFAVVREVCVGDEERNGPVRYLSVRVMRTHDAVYVADHDWFDLERAKLAMPATGKIVSVGFDLDERGEKQWMHDLMRDGVIFMRFDAREGFMRRKSRRVRRSRSCCPSMLSPNIRQSSGKRRTIGHGDQS